LSKKENGKKGEDTTLRIGDRIFDLESLRDPPIGLWELLERKGMFDGAGNLSIESMSQGFEFLHCALCATEGPAAIEVMLREGEPPIDRVVITAIPSSQLKPTMEKISAIMGGATADVTAMGPTSGKSLTLPTNSDAPMDGPLEKSAP